jgi:transcriptional regulator with XRE-family HTH domain
MLNRALRLLRTYHQLNQVELAKLLAISNSYLSEIESGDKSPSLEILDKYADIFKMPVSSIMLFSESMGEERMPGAKLRVGSANKVLRLLEWLEERNIVSSHA